MKDKKEKLPRFCSYCGNKLVSQDSSKFDPDTGKRLRDLVCLQALPSDGPDEFEQKITDVEAQANEYNQNRWFWQSPVQPITDFLYIGSRMEHIIRQRHTWVKGIK